MKKRRIFVSVLALLLAVLIIAGCFTMVLGSAGAVTQAEIDALEEEKDAVAAKGEELQAQIDELDAERESYLELKQALDDQSELLRQEIELINEQIQIYDQMVEVKAKELEEARAREQAQYEALRVRMRAMEKTTAMDYVAILFDSSSFSDLLGRIEMINDVMRADKQLQEEYIAASEHVQQVKTEYENLLAETELKKEELLQKKDELEAQIQEAYEIIAQLEADIEEYKRAYEENEAAEAALQAELSKLEEELRKQEEAAKQQYGNSSIVSTGSLIWPAPSCGYVTSPYGWRVHPIFGYDKFHYGVDIPAYAGANILASDSGTVAVATYSSSYGNYVMINHGGGVHTLYAHMSTLLVSAGQSVSQGQVIGYCGSTGWSTGPHLHYEVRRNGSTVDPLQYFPGVPVY